MPTRESLRLLGLEKAWYLYVPLGAGESLIRISETEDTVFAQTSLGNLYAIDADAQRIFGWAVDENASLSPIGSWSGIPATVAGLAAS